MDIKSVLEGMNDDIQAVDSFCEELYQTNFARYFSRQRTLFDRLQSKTRPVTDEELEDIMTSIPLDLFTASEQLSRTKLAHEVIKMKNKEAIHQRRQKSTQITLTEKNNEAEIDLVENVLIDTIYDSVINRVEREISFSRELIMGAKKVWDRRRQAEGANPINPVNPQLPNRDTKTFYEQLQGSKGQPIYGG